jgi:hypothetical protein
MIGMLHRDPRLESALNNVRKNQWLAPLIKRYLDGPIWEIDIQLVWHDAASTPTGCTPPNSYTVMKDAPRYVTHLQPYGDNLASKKKYGDDRPSTPEVSLAHELGHIYFDFMFDREFVMLPPRFVLKGKTKDDYANAYDEAVARMWENCMRPPGQQVWVLDASGGLCNPDPGFQRLIATADPGLLRQPSPDLVWSLIQSWTYNM